MTGKVGRDGRLFGLVFVILVVFRRRRLNRRLRRHVFGRRRPRRSNVVALRRRAGNKEVRWESRRDVAGGAADEIVFVAAAHRSVTDFLLRLVPEIEK